MLDQFFLAGAATLGVAEGECRSRKVNAGEV